MTDTFGRQDGHDPEADENCATGLCEHERGPAAARPPAFSADFVIEAFFGSSSRLHARLTDPEGRP